MSMASKTSCSRAVQFSRDGHRCRQIAGISPVYYGYTHSWTILHTVMSWISGAYECWSYLALTWSDLNYYKFVLSVSSLPLSVIVRSYLACVVNLSSLRFEFLSRWRCVIACSSPSLSISSAHQCTSSIFVIGASLSEPHLFAQARPNYIWQLHRPTWVTIQLLQILRHNGCLSGLKPAHCKKYLVKMTTSAWLLQFQGSLNSNRWVAWLKEFHNTIITHNSI